MRFERLTVKEIFSENKRNKAICICDCGKEKIVRMEHLRSGATKSCGCLQKEAVIKTMTKHDGKGTSLYNRWKAVRQRCNNEHNSRFKDYGGRGITLCNEWEEFINFKKWALENGYNEEMQLDRIDNAKGYFPDNCRWVTPTVNGRNRRNTVKVEGRTLSEIAEENNLTYNKLKHLYYYKNKPTTIKELLSYANQLPTIEGIR